MTPVEQQWWIADQLELMGFMVKQVQDALLEMQAPVPQPEDKPMRPIRLKIETVHGEGRTLYYICSLDAPIDEQPAVLITCNSLEEARHIKEHLEQSK